MRSYRFRNTCIENKCFIAIRHQTCRSTDCCACCCCTVVGYHEISRRIRSRGRWRYSGGAGGALAAGGCATVGAGSGADCRLVEAWRARLARPAVQARVAGRAFAVRNERGSLSRCCVERAECTSSCRSVIIGCALRQHVCDVREEHQYDAAERAAGDHDRVV
jgi:hypothetical protein